MVMNMNGLKWKIITFTVYYCVTQTCAVWFLTKSRSVQIFQVCTVQTYIFHGFASTIEHLISCIGEIPESSAGFHIKVLNPEL